MIKTKKGLEILARFKLGNETRECKYWKKEEGRKCRICGEKEENIEQMLEKCKETRVKESNWIEQLTKGRKTMARLKRISWMRKEQEKKEERINLTLVGNG